MALRFRTDTGTAPPTNKNTAEMGYPSGFKPLSMIQNATLIMTSADFNECSLSERVRFTLRTGTYLQEMEHANFKLHLYSVLDFFVEVKITQESGDVESVWAISSEEATKFLENIALPGSSSF